jgi:hypothetical protein
MEESDEEHEEVFPESMVNWQSNVSLGLGGPGEINGVVVLVTDKVTTAAPTRKLAQIAGEAAYGRPDIVMTAQHSLSAAIKEICGSVHGDVEVWAVPAHAFYSLMQVISIWELFTNVQGILALVSAVGYYSRVDPAAMSNSRRIPNKIDFSVIKLLKGMNLPPRQPQILTEGGLAGLIEFLMDGRPHPVLKVALEGMGSHFSTGDRVRFVDTLPIQWDEAPVISWTYTEKRRAGAQEFAGALAKALPTHPVSDNHGIVRLENMYIPPGFSGGGAYVTVPARAVKPAACNEEPGNPPLTITRVRIDDLAALACVSSLIYACPIPLRKYQCACT